MILTVWRKEMKAQLYTWKGMIWLVIASLLFSLTCYLLLTNQELSLLDQTELMWLLSEIIIGVAFLVVTIEASSTITSEFEMETAESVFLSPLPLAAFLTGKMLALMTLWAAVYIVAVPYIIVASAGTNLTLPFLLYEFLYGALGAAAWVTIISAISLIYRSAKNTMTTALAILLVLSVPALFSSTLKNNAVAQVVSRINPIDNIFASLDNVLVDYQVALTNNLKYLLPVVLFCLIGAALLILAARTFRRQGAIKSV